MNPSDAPGLASGPPPRPGRRAFLTGAGAAALAGLGIACSPADRESGESGQGSVGAGGTTTISDPIPFRGARQQGVLRDPAPAGLVAAFDVAVGSHGELARTLQQLTVEVERIMDGGPAPTEEEILPPPDSGILGTDPQDRSVVTSVTLAVGASLFDGRFGLADRSPAELIPMPRFFNDRLVRPELSHGDLALVIASDIHHGAAHALHQVVRATSGRLRLRWVQEGHNDLLPPADGAIARSRNLMGFRDGTSNLDTADVAVMDRHVWVQGEDGEPDWAIGGTYLTVRVIRILIEFWATAALVRQEQIFGRHRQSGAPFGQTTEGEEPVFASNPDDQTVPVRSHMRLANPRTPDTGRILRRGFSYLNGVDLGGAMDQGLLFLGYGRSLTGGFLDIQSRLEGEPLEDYIKPVGGGIFFVVPGPGDDGWLGQSLLG